MAKTLPVILLVLITGFLNWSCSETENNNAGDLEKTLTKIYQEVNSEEVALDSAWVISNENSDDKMLKLYGQKNIDGTYESIITYIQIKANEDGNYQPVSVSKTGASVVSCVSKNCKPCDLKDIWTEKAYCD